jgi:hypothetical protein
MIMDMDKLLFLLIVHEYEYEFLVTLSYPLAVLILPNKVGQLRDLLVATSYNTDNLLLEIYK